MTNIRRYYIPDAIYFITCVTYQRRDLFTLQKSIALFWEITRNLKKIHPYKLYAHVLIPDHFHFLLQPLKEDVSMVMQSLKDNFSRHYKKLHGIKTNIRVWQYRFWDHVIRNQDDFNHHFDYIHYNPVKHRIVGKPEDSKQSSYLNWVRKGIYQIGWGHLELKNLEEMNLE
jgi:putative transposase